MQYESERIQSAAERLAALAERHSLNGLVEQAKEIGSLLGQRCFRMAVLGQFKRGKSTLVNALLGAELMPTGILPLTSAIVSIAYGGVAQVDVQFRDGPSQVIPVNALADYVTEAGNPQNVKQVARVEVRIPSPFLHPEVILVDTPGISSVHQHNTAETERYLDRVDVAVFVLGVDPPISQDELQLIKQVTPLAGHSFFVLNKSDLATPEEIVQAVAFTEKVLESANVSSADRVIAVSARDGLAAKLSDSPELLECSGLAAFESRVMRFRQNEATVSLQSAAVRKLERLAKILESTLSLREQALTMPWEQLLEAERRVRSYFELLGEEEDLRLSAVRGYRRTLIETLDQLWQEYLRRAIAETLVEFQAGRDGDSAWLELEHRVTDLVKQRLAAWADHLEQWLQHSLGDVQAKTVDCIDEIAGEADRLTQALFGVRFAYTRANAAAQPDQHLYFDLSQSHSYVLPDWASIAVRLPGAYGKRARVEQGKRLLRQLLERNIGRLRASVAGRLEQALREFEQQFFLQLDQMKSQLLGTVEAIVSQRASEESRVAEMKAQLELSHRDLQELLGELQETR